MGGHEKEQVVLIVFKVLASNEERNLVQLITALGLSSNITRRPIYRILTWTKPLVQT